MNEEQYEDTRRLLALILQANGKPKDEVDQWHNGPALARLIGNLVVELGGKAPQ